MLTETHILVRGLVQGVGFRFATQRAARAIGIRGYVRNLPNGDVEIVAQGEPEAVERLIDWARHGPAGARVEQVTVQTRAPTSVLSGFEIR
jgi:acylphosphatase